MGQSILFDRESHSIESDAADITTIGPKTSRSKQVVSFSVSNSFASGSDIMMQEGLRKLRSIVDNFDADTAVNHFFAIGQYHTNGEVQAIGSLKSVIQLGE
ncbi:hypothetical protein C8233_17925 [Halomonas sp. SF2003]|nr:hypothetical protein C8233_17925 [Halomonas sp. SF2003]